MAKKSTITTTLEEIRPADLPAFRRTQWFETTKTAIQIFLMAVLALGLLAFLILTILAGVTVNILPITDGTVALSHLFSEIAVNAKTVALFALGFFFREYLSLKNAK